MPKSADPQYYWAGGAAHHVGTGDTAGRVRLRGGSGKAAERVTLWSGRLGHPRLRAWCASVFSGVRIGFQM